MTKKSIGDSVADEQQIKAIKGAQTMKDGKWESQTGVTKLSEGQTQQKNVDATLGGTTEWNSHGWAGDVLATKKSAPEAGEQAAKLENGIFGPQNLTQQKAISNYTNDATTLNDEQKKNAGEANLRLETPIQPQRRSSSNLSGDKSPKPTGDKTPKSIRNFGE